MKLNKKDKEIIKDKIEGKKIIKDDRVFLNWEAGQCEYNIDVKQKEIFTKEQYGEIRRLIKEETDPINDKIDTVIAILARNGFK